MLNYIISKLIWFIHVCIILFVVIIPFSNSNYFIMLHSIFIPFMLLHWFTNNDTCVLTMIEKRFRNVKTKEDEEDCFTCRLINPIFNFNKNNINISALLYIIVILLWFMSISRLMLKYKNGEIENYKDLFVIKK